MSDVMLLGVLRMPMPDNPDPLTLRQFVDRARQAADRIEADADEIERLRAEVDALREANDTFARESILPDHLTIVEKTEVEALRADAERYRWLRDNAVREKPLGDKYIEFHCDFEAWNDVDAAIDAEIAEEREAAAVLCEQTRERIKHTSHRDGLGMGDLSREALCDEISAAIRSRGKS